MAKHLLGELQHHRDDPENAVVTEGNVENDDTENNKEQVTNYTLKEQLYGDESDVKLEPYKLMEHCSTSGRCFKTKHLLSMHIRNKHLLQNSQFLSVENVL